MDLDDLLSLLWPLLFFGISIISRVARLRKKSEKTPEPVSDTELEYNSAEHEYDEDEGDAYVEVAPGSSERQGGREQLATEVQRQLGDVFRNLGLDVSFEQPRQESTAEYVEPEVVREFVPDESVVEVVPDERVFEVVPDEVVYEDVPAETVDDDATAREYERLRERLEAQRRAAVAQAEHLRAGRHLNSSSVRSAEVIRDAIVLDALLHRPQWGRLPLKRGAG